MSKIPYPNQNETYIDLCAQGLTNPNEIDDWIDSWHENKIDPREMHEVFGLTLQEFGEFTAHKFDLTEKINQAKRKIQKVSNRN